MTKLCHTERDHPANFYPRDAMLARVIVIATCLSVCLSICPSRAGIDLCGSHPLVTPYYCRLGDLLCFVFTCMIIVFFCYLCNVCLPSVLWYCWLGLLTCKNRRPYNLYCVGGDFKPCSINQSIKRRKLAAWFLHHLVAPRLVFWHQISSPNSKGSVGKIERFLPASAGNRHSNVSVCLSVRPSVTRRYCGKTKKACGMISSPSGSPKTLVFWCQISSPDSKGFPPNGGLKQGSVGKIQRFSSFLL